MEKTSQSFKDDVFPPRLDSLAFLLTAGRSFNKPSLFPADQLPLAKRSSGSSHEQNWRTADSQYSFTINRFCHLLSEHLAFGGYSIIFHGVPFSPRFSPVSRRLSIVVPMVFHGSSLVHGFSRKKNRLDFSWSLGTFEP